MTAKFVDPDEMTPGSGPSAAPGIVLHSPRLYDLMARAFFVGRERSFRERLLSLAGPRPGEHVLDVGCGTGSMAILAKRRVGTTGSVVGIDASEQMLTQARRKADHAGVKVEFQQAPAQKLPFAAAQFDLVLSTLMLHHLARPARMQLACEARRVLKPGGRVLVVDFEMSSARKSLLWRALRHRHGGIAAGEIAHCLADAGFHVIEKGPVGFNKLTFALAVAAPDSQR